MTNWYDVVHLDRLCVIGTSDLSYSDPTTTITLPLTDNTLDTAILGPSYGNNSGKVITLDTNGAGTATIVDAGNDYSTGEIVVGRGYTFQMQLTRPFYTGSGRMADFDAELQIREISANLHRTAYATIRTEMAGRASRSKNYDTNNIQERVLLNAYFNGDAKKMSIFLENNQPKPSTFSSVQFVGHHLPRTG